MNHRIKWPLIYKLIFDHFNCSMFPIVVELVFSVLAISAYLLWSYLLCIKKAQETNMTGHQTITSFILSFLIKKPL